MYFYATVVVSSFAFLLLLFSLAMTYCILVMADQVVGYKATCVMKVVINVDLNGQ